MVFQSRYENPTTLGKALVPGIPILPHGVERHIVPGGGSRGIKIDKGDEITVVDSQGLQMAEMVFFAPNGISDAGMIGAKGQGRANNIINLLSSGDESGQKVLMALDKSGFDIKQSDAICVFKDGSRAGDSVHFSSSSDGLLIIAAPGVSMSPETQQFPTELIIYVEREKPINEKGNLMPPTPLAEPLEDLNIQPGHVTSYEVKSGQYIQVLDVQGRECSDFQAFSIRALDKGLEREIDPTTTRSLMGNLYPSPGIFSKYWSSDQEALIEIVQDTCGRHDTFGLACSARYYEEMGYPGHVNCTDNMNINLPKFNIKPRGGWPAINFFFNTILDDTNSIGMDDPWSRPGDYVMLRALTDLVCISTACPCDVDPANGWNPTDIQVRVYKENENFKKSIGFRKSVESEMEETKQTGFHNCFAKYTREFNEYNGYWLANQMTNSGFIAEYWAAREKAIITDLSPLRKYEITGPDSEKLMQLCVTRNVKKMSVGDVVYTAMCYEHGGMIDDGTIFRLGENNFRWIGGNDTSGIWLGEKARENNFDVWVRNSTDQLCNIAIQGVLSRDILKKLIWTGPTQPNMDELQWFKFAIARIGDYNGIPLVVSRTGYTGELGFEIFCHPKNAEEVFNVIYKVGEPLGMKPMGLAALDMLRIEAGLIFAGYEFSDQTDPFEAGIGFTVPLKTQEDDFIGRKAIERRKISPHKKLIGLDIEGGIVPNNGDPIRIGKAQIGEITSSVKSPILGKVIALCRLDITYCELGTSVEIGQLDGYQKRLQAKVVSLSHFDPNKERVKGNYIV